MSLLPWKRRDLQQQLSAYIDGELDPQKVPSMGEDLVFDRELRDTLADYAHTDALVSQALAPETLPDARAFADAVVETLPTEQTNPVHSHRIKPAFWASVGILVTAGIAIAGLKRRGLV